MATTDQLPIPFARLTLDPTGDGQLTPADLGELFYNAFFLPGDAFIWALSTFALPVAEQLGVGVDDYGGFLAAMISLCVWVTVFVELMVVYQYVLELDRRVTRATVRGFRTATLHVRIARTVLLQRWRTWREARRVRANRVDFPSEIELSAAELKALRLHAELASGYSLSVIETARTLGLRNRAAQDLLDGLKEVGLLNRTLGGADGDSAYTLSEAGKALLVFRQLHNDQQPVAESR